MDKKNRSQLKKTIGQVLYENKRIKLLAICENQDNLINLKAQLADQFLEADIFTTLSRKEGLELAGNMNPDVILLDVVGSEMDCFEDCQALKSDERLKDIPVIFIAALKGNEESRICALEAGTETFIAKPINKSELTAQIRAMVKIKNANNKIKDKKQIPADLAREQTQELNNDYTATLNLLEDLKNENEARRKSEEELAHSEEKYRLLAEHSYDVIWKLDIQSFRFTYISPSVFKMRGYTAEEALNQTVEESLTPETYLKVMAMFQERMSDIFGDDIDLANEIIELAQPCKDGSVVYVEASVSLIRDENGRPREFLGVSRNITERKKFNMQLEASKAYAENLIETANTMVVGLDVNGNVITFNKAAEEISGYSREEILGKNWFEIIVPIEKYPEVWAEFSRLTEREGVPKSWENAILTKSGEERYIVWKNSEVIVDGKITGTISFGMDTTDQRKAVELLRQNEEKYRNIFTNIQDAYYETTLEGTILEISPSIENISSYKREELIGNNINSHYVSVTERDALISEMKLKGYVNDYEIVLKDKNGEKQRCSITSKLVFDNQGNPLKIVGSMRNIEERKLAEEMNRELEMKFTDLVKNANDIIFTADLKGNFISVNPAIQKILGYTPAEFIGRNSKEIIGPASIELTNQNLRIKMDGKRHQTNYEIDVIAKNRRMVRLEISTYLHYKNNEPVEVFGISRDITERTRLINELNHKFDTQNVINTLLKMSLSDMKLSDLLEQAFKMITEIPWLNFKRKGAVFLKDESGVMRMSASYNLSEEMKELCSVVMPGRCICGKALLEKKINFVASVNENHHIQPYGMDDHGHYCMPVLMAGEVTGIINIYLEKGHYYSDEEVDFLESVSNTLAGIFAMKKVEAALKDSLETMEEKVVERTMDLSRSEELYRSTVNSFKDWVYVVDRDMKLVSVNEALEHFFRKNGYAGNFRGEYINRIFTYLDNDTLSKIENTFKDGEAKTNESGYNVFNTFVYAQRVITPVIHEGEVVRVVVTVRDISKFKEAEEEIGKNLEKEKELNSLKSQFISTVSHEFRTPLAGILSSVQLLKRYGDKWDGVKKEKLYNQIFDAVNHTKVLLDDVSLIDKEQSKKITVRPSMINLQDLIQGIADENRQVYGPDFELKPVFKLKKSEYYFDRELLRHIFGNVLSNAIKYSGESKKVKFIIAEKKNDIQFDIVDYGIGIPDEDQKFIFEPFHRASNVELIQGTGFGLSIVKRFVDMHSGSIKVVSQVGKGTTVTIKLPIMFEEEGEEVVSSK